jgi:uncharacterized membrane protein
VDLPRKLTEFEKTTNFQPALIEIENALVPGFFVEQHTNDRCTVFVPSVPTPMAGALYIIATSRVHRLNLPVDQGHAVHLKMGLRQ